jgi:hypothetical protein
MRLKQISPNFHALEAGGHIVWFSYETPIGYTNHIGSSTPIFISENEWSRTTGKHLNFIKGDGDNVKEVTHLHLLDVITIHMN